MGDNFLFMTGVARGGTSLAGRMVDAHPGASVAIDAYLPLFRGLRNAILCHAAEPGSHFDPAAPIEDGHFSAPRRRGVETALGASLEIPFPLEGRSDLADALRRRASDESGDLVPFIGEPAGETCRGVLLDALAWIVKARPADGNRWIGVKDLWIVDLFPALARAFPQARFVLILRDPRATAASVLGFKDIDLSQCPHVLSVLRHWRKVVACSFAFASDPLLADRLAVVRYEDIVAHPDRFGRDVCRLLEMEFDPAMTRFSGFRDYVGGGQWKGNSTFTETLDDISTRPMDSWRRKLPPEALKLVEFTCGADMLHCGYQPECSDLCGDPDVLSFLMKDGARPCSWRSDFQDQQKDYGFESFRRTALGLSHPELDPETIRHCFLFDGYYRHLRQIRQSESSR